MPDYTVLPGAMRLPKHAVEAWHPGVHPAAIDALQADGLWVEWKQKERSARTWRRRAVRTASVGMAVSLLLVMVSVPLGPTLAWASSLLAVLSAATCGALVYLANSRVRHCARTVQELERIRDEAIRESNAQFKLKEEP